jgi:DNA topoisomerase-3
VVEAQFAQAPDTRYKGIWQGERLDDREKAVQIAGRVNGKAGVIAGYEAKESKEYPARLYDLTLLQREANARYGFSAQKTLDLAQALYEKHKVITYPRTSSNYVNEENIQGMHKALDALVDTAYGALAAGADRSRVHARNRAVCNPAMVEDHHAILPTRKKAGTLSPDEAKVYDLVVRRFLSHYYPPAEYTVHTILTEVERERFKTVLKELRHAGWKVVYEHSDGSAGKKGGRRSAETEEQEAETTVSGFALRIREPVQCRKAEVLDKETRPPKPYTEGTLLKAMESAGRQLEDEALREAMKDAGLGTPATRAAIIERLKQVGYVEMKGKQIAVTPKGRTAVELIRGAGIDLLTSPEMTGQWERRLNAIAKGLAADGPFLENVKRFSRLIVAKVAEQPPAAPGALEAAGGRGKRRAAGGRSPRSRGAAKGAAPAAAAPRNGGAFPPRAAARADGSRPAGAGMPAVARAARGGTAARLNEASSVRSSAVPPAAASAAAPAALPPPRTIGACPRPGCGGRIFMGRRGYGCSRYKDGCGFVIWKQSFGRSLTETMIRSLLTKGRTNRLKLTDASGRSYDARLVLVDRNTGKLGIES